MNFNSKCEASKEFLSLMPAASKRVMSRDFSWDLMIFSLLIVKNKGAASVFSAGF